MAPYSSVAIAGASGNIGKPVLAALIEAGIFDITVLSREGSAASFPDGVKVVRVDYSSHDALVAALKGIEALVLTIGDPQNLEKNQKVFIDAAIDAGVKRVIPSEFGNDTSLPPGSTAPVFAQKVGTEHYLREKAAAGEITWTAVYNGPFFDWCLDTGFIGFEIKDRKAILYDDGARKFSPTTLGTVGKGVVGILSHPETTENKGIHLSDAFITQREILQVLESELGTKFETTSPRVPDVLAEANAAAAKGDVGYPTIVGWVNATIWGEESSARWEKNDHGLIGLPDRLLDWKDVVKAKAAQYK